MIGLRAAGRNPEDRAKKALAFALADKFLSEIEDHYRDDRDEGMALMIAVAKFICRHEADPQEFLTWLNEGVMNAIDAGARR